MTDPRFGAGDLGPGENAPGPSSFPGRSRGGGRRAIAFPGRKAPAPSKAVSPGGDPAAGRPAPAPDGVLPEESSDVVVGSSAASVAPLSPASLVSPASSV